MAEMSKERQFAAALEGVRQTARAQGNIISQNEVRAAFADQELSDEQYDLIFDYLKKHKIGVDDAVEMDDYLTAAEKNYLADYLTGLRGLRSYSPAEKAALLMAAAAGDRGAEAALIEHYLPQVAELAKLYTEQGVFLEDLIGEGNVRLTAGAAGLNGAQTAEEAEGMLIRMVMAGMETLIADTAKLRQADQKIEARVNTVAQAAAELAEALGRKVTVSELAKEGGLSEKAIWEALQISGRALEDIEDEQRDA